MPYTASQMFALIADIEAYPEFLPWCSALRIRNQDQTPQGKVIDADMVISFKVFREKFGSRVTLHHAQNEISVEYLDGPFKYLTNLWKFVDTDDGCSVDFLVDFEFKSKILQALIGVVFEDAMHKIVHAFEQRAATLYGAAHT